MNKLDEKFIEAMKSSGLDFLKKLLAYEDERYAENFSKNTVFEEMNEDFGLFPMSKHPPLYFMGDITKPEHKIIVIGINPGYSTKEGDDNWFENSTSSFDFYLNAFQVLKNNNRNSNYFSNIASLLEHIGKKPSSGGKKLDWQWFHDNVINLDLIPYPSSNTGGLRANDKEKYRERYFKPLIKIIEYLNPTSPIYIVGFPTFINHIYDMNALKKNLINFNRLYPDGIWTGYIAERYKFIGTPFLNRVKGGKQSLANQIKREIS